MKEGYKQTELGVIPEDWSVFKFTDIAELIHGFQFREEHFCTNGKYSVVKIGNLSSKGQVEVQNISQTDCTNIKNFERLFLKKGDILMALTGGTLGKVAIFDLEEDKYLQNYRVGKFISNEKSVSSYLAFLLKSHYVQNRIMDNVNEAAQPNFGKQDFDKIKIPLPPIEEQNAIANCLSTWDEAIEKQHKLIDAKEIRHKALMQKLLSGKKRLPGFTDEWKEYKFSDLIKEVKRKETWDDTKLYDLISVRRRSGGVFHRESLYGHQIEVKSLVKIKENDFLISKMQIVHGASSIVPKKFEDYYVSGSYIILNIKNDKILSPKYLNLYSKQKSFYYQTFVSSYGVHIEKMTFDFKTFLKMSAIIPTLNEQNRIVEIIDTSNQELEIEKQKVDQLKEQKKALMQRLLTGKVRLPLNK